MTLKELDKVNSGVACTYFNDCFKNPAEFTLCITGSYEASFATSHCFSFPFLNAALPKSITQTALHNCLQHHGSPCLLPIN